MLLSLAVGSGTASERGDNAHGEDGALSMLQRSDRTQGEVEE